MRLHKLLDDAHARIVRVEADAEQLRSELALRLGQPAVSMPRHAELIGRSVSAAMHCPGVLLRTALGAHSDMRVGFANIAAFSLNRYTGASSTIIVVPCQPARWQVSYSFPQPSHCDR